MVGGAIDGTVAMEAVRGIPKDAITAVPLAPSLSASQIQSYLADLLPDYMIPRTVRILDQLPLSAVGKVDRANVVSGHAEEPALAPATTAKHEHVGKVIELLCEELGLPEAEPDDNFFDLGATSLTIIRLQQAIRRTMNIDLPVVDLFRNPNAAALARHIGGGTAARGDLMTVTERASRRRATRRRPPHRPDSTVKD
jgi:acyl carrier protein